MALIDSYITYDEFFVNNVFGEYDGLKEEFKSLIIQQLATNLVDPTRAKSFDT